MAAQLTTPKIVEETDTLLQSLGIPREAYTGGSMAVHSPITGEEIAKVHAVTAAE